MSLQDYALIELDRDVLNSESIKISSKRKIEDDAEVFLLGHPYGLPMTLAENGRIFDNRNEHYFATDLDVFAGNSGSPVFNAKTYELEGIFVGGGIDAVTDIESENYCRRWFSCDVGQPGCETEDVTRIQSIPIGEIQKDM